VLSRLIKPYEKFTKIRFQRDKTMFCEEVTFSDFDTQEAMVKTKKNHAVRAGSRNCGMKIFTS
jgi:hypothetical protein